MQFQSHQRNAFRFFKQTFSCATAFTPKTSSSFQILQPEQRHQRRLLLGNRNNLCVLMMLRRPPSDGDQQCGLDHIRDQSGELLS